jgi:peptidyl-Lys metalloendopeptidase
MKSPVIKAALAVLAAAASFGAHAAASDITVTIDPVKTRLGKADDVLVKVTVTNHGSSPELVLKWQTPFGGEVEEPLFDVTRDGAPVRYRGPHYKRPAPTRADYYLLKPGRSYSTRVELSSVYDMSVSGDYQVSYHVRGMDMFTPADKSIHELKSNAASMYIDGAYPRGTVLPEPLALAAAATGQSLSYNRCSASQQADIVNARNAALAMTTDGDSYLAANQTGTRYTHWFGAVTSARYSTMQQHFVALKDAFANKPITVDCTCKKSYYAFVYPDKPYVIHVCKAFWSAPMTGTDSKGGTLVHEMSHFTVVAGTDDIVYGQSGAANLALTNPDQAIDNADSHEYFGENTPALQ